MICIGLMTIIALEQMIYSALILVAVSALLWYLSSRKQRNEKSPSILEYPDRIGRQ